MKLAISALKANDTQIDNSTATNELINKVALFLDKINENGDCISERDRISGYIAIAMKKTGWWLQENYPSCEFEITFTGHVPLLGAVIIVKQTKGKSLNDDDVKTIKNLIHNEGIWDDPDLGIFNHQTVLLRGRFLYKCNDTE